MGNPQLVGDHASLAEREVAGAEEHLQIPLAVLEEMTSSSDVCRSCVRTV